MNFLLAVLVVAGFAGTIGYLDLPKRAQEVVRRGTDCLGVLKDSSLDDEAKERALQGHARRLFGLLGILAGGSALALGLPLAGVWVSEGVGVASVQGVWTILRRVDFLVGTAVVGVLGCLLVRQVQSSVNADERYGRLDRLLYHVAFRSGTAQHALADMEDMLYRDRLDASPVDPVFITALPRSGTTMLLRLLAQTESFASHTYQDMPFVLCPMLWNQFSDQFSREDTPRERMHGDGIQVAGKSPEAFEEMIWKHFWPDHYRRRQIRPWRSTDTNQEFNSFFKTHMRKIAALRCENGASNVRYLSKNNLNIARLAAPPSPLHAGTFLIPFRDPIQQAASMLRQHRRFLNIHEENDFVREYMEAIGHYEFGKELRPVNFGGWLEEAPSPNGLEYWVRYWIATYEHVLTHAGASTVIISYARLTKESKSALSRLANALGLPASDLAPQAERLHPPRTHSVDEAVLSDAVLQEAYEVYERLDQEAEV